MAEPPEQARARREEEEFLPLLQLMVAAGAQAEEARARRDVLAILWPYLWFGLGFLVWATLIPVGDVAGSSGSGGGPRSSARFSVVVSGFGQPGGVFRRKTESWTASFSESDGRVVGLEDPRAVAVLLGAFPEATLAPRVTWSVDGAAAGLGLGLATLFTLVIGSWWSGLKGASRGKPALRPQLLAWAILPAFFASIMTLAFLDGLRFRPQSFTLVSPDIAAIATCYFLCVIVTAGLAARWGGERGPDELEAVAP